MQKITLIGLGKMGTAIASKLLQVGFPMTVYNRTISKTAALEKSGAKVARNDGIHRRYDISWYETEQPVIKFPPSSSYC